MNHVQHPVSDSFSVSQMILYDRHIDRHNRVSDRLSMMINTPVPIIIGLIMVIGYMIGYITTILFSSFIVSQEKDVPM